MPPSSREPAAPPTGNKKKYGWSGSRDRDYSVLHDVMAQTASPLWSRYGGTLWYRLCFKEWRKLLRRSSRLKRHFYTCSLLQDCAGDVRMRSGGVRLVEGAVVLGVETSCDDTGVGVVDVSGRVRGEALHSQLKEHQK